MLKSGFTLEQLNIKTLMSVWGSNNGIPFLWHGFTLKTCKKKCISALACTRAGLRLPYGATWDRAAMVQETPAGYDAYHRFHFKSSMGTVSRNESVSNGSMHRRELLKWHC